MHSLKGFTNMGLPIWFSQVAAVPELLPTASILMVVTRPGLKFPALRLRALSLEKA